MKVTIDLGWLLKGGLCLFWGLVLTVQRTDADLKDIEIIPGNRWEATTLDFVNQSTDNNLPKSLLFGISGLQPNGFSVQSVRIKKEGRESFNYEINSQFTGGSQILFQNLTVMIIKNWEIVEQGKLNEISFSSQVDKEKEDLVFVLSLENDQENLVNQSSTFNLVFKTTTNIEGEDMGFFDEEIIQNQVSSGSWF